MKNRDIEKEILFKSVEKFLNDNNSEKLELVIKDFYPFEFYDFIKEWSILKLVKLFHLIGPKYSSDIFKEFDVNKQIDLIEGFSDEEIKQIFSEYYTDESVDILEEYPYKIIQKVLNTLDIKEKIKINRIFTFAKHQCGFHMIIDFVSISENQLIKDAKNQIKNEIKVKENEIIGNIFVVNKEKKFLGYVKPETIFVANDKDNVNDYIEEINAVRATENISIAENIMSKFNVSSVPVIDNNGILLGAIEAEDVIEMYEEVEESFLESSNIKLTDKSYIDTSVYTIFKSRVWWIVALLFIGSLTQIIIMLFQNIWESAGVWTGIESATISSIVTLALVNSISVASSVNDAAGNSGSQTSATIVRSLAIGEITKSDYGKVIYKELKVSILIGASAAIASFFRMVIVWSLVGPLWPRHLQEAAEIHNQTIGWIIGWMTIISLVSSITFFISIIIGNLTGVLLPIIAHSRNSDGAIISGPVQTTIVDILTFTVYLTLTTIIFIPLSNSGYFDLDNSATILRSVY